MIEWIDASTLAINTGVLTLIWLVQLVIYPGLDRYTSTELRSWHPVYTQRVSFVVLPLMMSQLMLSVYSVWVTPELSQITHLILVIIAWLITFLWAVPLHQSVDRGNLGNSTVLQLIRINGYRTLVWSLAWGVSVYAVFGKLYIQ